MTYEEPQFMSSLISGAAAGVAVDLTLFPLDTIKTRLQTSHGFWQSGGFRGIYSGVASAALGSAPNAALFFVTYDTTKKLLRPHCDSRSYPFVHMFAACTGEVAACIVRVPVEVVKQRAQAFQLSSMLMFRKTLAREGIKGLYRGYLTTVSREIPFALIQYPLWEKLKNKWTTKQGYYVESWKASICGAVAGGIAAGLTTPMDVAKTRIMLAERNSKIASGSILYVLQQVYAAGGIKGLFAGIVPRVCWISIGGAIFFGVYEKSKHTLHLTDMRVF